MKETIVMVREAHRFDPHVIGMLIHRVKEHATDSIISGWLLDDTTNEVIKQLLQVDCFVVAKSGGEVVAVISKDLVACSTPGCEKEHEPAVRCLYVSAGHHHVGRLLLNAVENEAAKAGLENIHAHIAIQPETTHDFFIRNGWQNADGMKDVYLKQITS